MQLCIYGTKEDKQKLLSAFEELESMTYRQIDADLFDCYDDLLNETKLNKYEIAIVTKDNAEGMEGVMAIKSICPQTPVVWFSNDRGFGTQSFRLDTAYFHEKPITPQILKIALDKCKTIL